MSDQAQNLRDMMQLKRSRSMPARVITVTSGKGGAGKSMVAVNLAIELSRQGCRTTLVDADFGLSNVDVMLGVNAEYDLSHVLKGEKTIFEVVNEGHCGVGFISGGNGVQELLDLNETQVSDLIRGFLQLEDISDIIIIDTGAGLNDKILRLIASGAEMLLVTTPEPTSILDAYAVIKSIDRLNCRPKIGLVINKAESIREALDTMDSFSRIVEKYTGMQAEKLGYIINDHQVVQAIKAQIPVVVSAPESVAAQNLAALARRVLEEAPDMDADGFIDRLILPER